jgi:FkbM family methyltransferase
MNIDDLQVDKLATIIKTHNLITDKNSLHSYCDFYEKELKKYQTEPVQLVEIGIDQGGSLLMWAEWFQQAQILGIDLQLRGDCEKNCSKYSNIMLSTGNAYMIESLEYFPEADIIIDDGPHDINSQIFAIEHFLPKVKSDGLFVIEDVPSIDTAMTLMTYVPKHLKSFAEIIDLRYVKGRSDDILFVVRVPYSKEKQNLDGNKSFTKLIKNPNGLGMDMLAERLSHLLPLINLNAIHEIVDIGSAHGYEAINFARVLPKVIVHGFEPTLEHYQFCLENAKNHGLDIIQRTKFYNIALNDKDGMISFYPLDLAQSKGNNTGMASKFKLINPSVFPHELSIQKEVMTPAAKLDTWAKIHGIVPDLIWMDAQGAELDILKGAEETLKSVFVIMTEAALKPYYHGHTMKIDIDSYLESQGFEEIVSARKTGHEYEVDAIYIRKSI